MVDDILMMRINISNRINRNYIASIKSDSKRQIEREDQRTALKAVNDHFEIGKTNIDEWNWDQYIDECLKQEWWEEEVWCKWQKQNKDKV